MGFDSTSNSVLPIGGFFGLAIDDIPLSRDSVWLEWTRRYSAVSKFGPGREALMALIATLVPRRVWLPAYYCGEVANAIVAATAKIGAEIHNFGLNRSLSRIFRTTALPLGMSLWPLTILAGLQPKFRDLARDRTDVVWVEDRAQTLWTADAPWGTWGIFSPRKLLGAAHGGLLLGSRTISHLEDNLSAPTDGLAVRTKQSEVHTTDRSDNERYANGRLV
jgi:hypothetical protein